MTSSLARTTIGLAMWGGCLAGALAIANLPWDLGHAICGPWGCGPPMQALVACHLAWFVVLVPPAVLLVRWSKASNTMRRRVGLLLVALAGAVLLAMMVYERLTWWPRASEWQRAHFWQRCGFVIATTVDVPVIQVLLIGVGLFLAGVVRWRFNCRRACRPKSSTPVHCPRSAALRE